MTLHILKTEISYQNIWILSLTCFIFSAIFTVVCLKLLLAPHLCFIWAPNFMGYF